jgi:hypothetical protein
VFGTERVGDLPAQSGSEGAIRADRIGRLAEVVEGGHDCTSS